AKEAPRAEPPHARAVPQYGERDLRGSGSVGGGVAGGDFAGSREPKRPDAAAGAGPAGAPVPNVTSEGKDDYPQDARIEDAGVENGGREDDASSSRKSRWKKEKKSKAKDQIRDEAVAAPRQDDGSEKVRTSRAPALIATVLVLLIALGIGAVVYSQWDTIVTAYDDVSGQVSSDETAQGTASGNAEDTTSSSPLTGLIESQGERVEGKDEDRLLSGPEAETPGAGPSTSQDEPMDAPLDGAPADEGLPDDTGESDGAGLPADETPPATPGTPDELSETAPSNDDAAGQAASGSLVGQRAIFYEQGADGAAGKAVNGAVSWSTVQRGDGGAAIQAKIDVPERDAEVTITISKNNDVALPASHLIEIAFTGSLDDTVAVQRVPALVMKPNEQARGQPLAGAAVDVTGDLYWIALSDTPDQVERNLELLRSGSWFDLPILFEGGKRALITFEKGIPGDKVFENVMQSWGDS
ncbi:hypothetical protein CKO34_07495, partial [Afifella marina]|nr:hypothetical protein [Afifella marina]